MKAVKPILVLLLVVTVFASCHKRDGFVFATSCTYYIDISFRDSLDNDLVAALVEESRTPEGDFSKWTDEINKDKYRLDVLMATPDGNIISVSLSELTLAKYDVNHRLLSVNDEELNSIEGYYYIEIALITSAKEFGLREIHTYQLTCSDIFGDSSIHEITSYWTFSLEDVNPPLKNDKYPECYGVLFDNQIIVPVRKATETRASHFTHFVDIIVAR